MVAAATECERQSRLNAARDVISVADVTEARGIVGESDSYLDDTWSSEELATRIRLNSGQRCVYKTHRTTSLNHTQD